jgi:hypothetical protein
MSGSTNQFNLANRVVAGPDAAVAAVTLSAEEQREKLTGYIEIQPDAWPYIKSETHMRYYTKKDGYRSGGFVTSNSLKKMGDGPDNTPQFFKIRSSYNKTDASPVWTVKYENIDKIFIKPDAGTLFVQDNLVFAAAGFNEINKKLTLKIKDLESRLRALEARL